ncbi:hypothetical protein PFISCL1PPCAC_21230, partial [Pristionchus fissidentatus]
RGLGCVGQIIVLTRVLNCHYALDGMDAVQAMVLNRHSRYLSESLNRVGTPSSQSADIRNCSILLRTI